MFETSFFVNVFNKVALFISVVFKNSLIGSAWQALKKVFQKLAQTSFFVKLAKLQFSKYSFNENSLLYRWMDRLINFLPWLLKKLYVRFEAAFKNSVLFRIVAFFARNLSALIALFMLVVFVVPHKTSFISWNNMYTAYAVILFFILFMIKAMIEEDTRIQVKAVNVFFYIFVIMVIYGLVTSFSFSLSLRFLVFHFTCFMLVLMMVSAIKTKEELTTFIELVLVGATLCGLYGLYQAVKGVPVDVSQIDISQNAGAPGRIYSTFENPNNFAQVMTMMIPFYVGVIFGAKGIKKKIIFVLAALPPVLSLLLTLSRTSWIGLAVAAFVFLLLTHPKVIPWLIVCGVLLLPVMPSYIITRIGTIFKMNDSSITYRFKIFKTMWPVIEDYSITGIGLGNNIVSQITNNYPIYTDYNKVPVHCHNLYLQVWAEMGIVGLTSLLMFIAATIKSCIGKVRRLGEDLQMKYFLASGVASISGILVTALGEYIWFYPRNMLVFWMIVGLMIVGLNLARNARHGEVME